MSFPNGETVVLTIPGTPTGADDGQGNPVLGPTTTITLEGVGVAPLANDETQETYGPRAVTGYLLLLPFGTTIPANATAEVRGETGWQVQVGSVDTDWRSPWTGHEFGTTVTVRRAG